MLGLFGLPAFETNAQRRERLDRRRAEREERLATAVHWTPDAKWGDRLTFTADSYRPTSLFDVEPLTRIDPRAAEPSQLAVSPDGRWAYCEKVLPRGHKLETYCGKRRGNVAFDGPVLIPALHSWRDWAGTRNEEPWMSITPMELLSLRPGTRKARGRVVVAGLGLGHQLIEVSRRRQVTSIVLVERDAALVEWIFPRLAPHLGMPVEVIVGDAFKVLPQLTADVALVDIFPGYGGNVWYTRTPNIRTIWCWGGANV